MSDINLQEMLGDKSWLFPDLQVTKDIKHGRAWRFESPDIGDDLEFQIFFKARFSSLVVGKKIARLVAEIEKGLSESNIPGVFHVDVVPEVQAVIITQEGFWKDFRSSPEAFSSIIEKACDNIL